MTGSMEGCIRVIIIYIYINFKDIMNKKNKIFSDLSKLATDAYGAFSGARKELETIIKIKVEKIINKADLVRREEFEVLKSIVQRVIKENEQLNKTIKKIQKKKAVKTTKKIKNNKNS